MLEIKKSNQALDELGEKEILNRLKIFMDKGQIDDDTALIKASSKDLIINTDIVVEDIHFNEKTTSATNVGWKAVIANLSDLACSGVEEIIGITVGLVVPSSTSWTWVDGAYIGIKNALDEFGGKLLGGDCSNGAQKILSITAFGTKGPLDLHRSNAKPGDYLVTSGPHGLSRLGLGLLLDDPFTKSFKLSSSLIRQSIQSHQMPQPPLQALHSLIRSKPEALPFKAAATDSSDGLVDAIEGLCQSSKCQAIIEPNSLPYPKNWPNGKLWKDWCLQGGEDFELVVSLPPQWARAWLKACPSSKSIGRMEEGPPKALWTNGELITKNTNSQYKHF